MAVYFGFTPSEWQAIGVMSGIVIGVAGLLVTWAYKHAHYKLAKASKTRVEFPEV